LEEWVRDKGLLLMDRVLFTDIFLRVKVSKASKLLYVQHVKENRLTLTLAEYA